MSIHICKYISYAFKIFTLILCGSTQLLSQTHLIIDRTALSDIPSANTMSAAESHMVDGIAPTGAYKISEPNITVFANPSGQTLQTVELLLYSSEDCIPYCNEDVDPRSKYFGTYVFEHYRMESNIKIPLSPSFEFTINQDLIDQNPGILLYENPNDGNSPIIRRLILNISGKGIVPPSNTHSYVSVKYIASPNSNIFEPGLERTVFILYSKYNGEAEGNTNSISSQSDSLSLTTNSGQTELQRVSDETHTLVGSKTPSSNTYYRFAAKYTLGQDDEEAQPILEISECRDLLDLNNTSHSEFVLTQNINCREFASFAPIHIDHPFKFNGNGKTISEININTTGNDAGLFATIPHGSSIKNLNILSSSMRGGTASGVLAGRVNAGDSSETIIDNVHVVAPSIINYEAPGQYSGGLIGFAGDNTTIMNSSANIWIITKAQYIGGLVGKIAGGKISRSFATGYVQAAPPDGTSSPLHAGGLVGHMSNTDISESYYDGLVEASCSDRTSNVYSGGIAGFVINGSIIANSYANVQLHATLSCSRRLVNVYLGGAAGHLRNESTIEQVHTSGTVDGPDYTAGIVGTTSVYGEVKNSFTTASVRAIERKVGDASVLGSIAGRVIRSTIDNCVVAGDYSYFPQQDQMIYDEENDTSIPVAAGDDIYLELGPCFSDASSDSTITNCNPESSQHSIQSLVSTWQSSIWDSSVSVREPKLKNVTSGL